MRRRDDAAGGIEYTEALAAYVLCLAARRSCHVSRLLLRFLWCRTAVCLIMDGRMYSNDIYQHFLRSATKVSSTLQDQKGNQCPHPDY